VIALLFAAIPPVPSPPAPIFTSTPAPISERAILENETDTALARGKAIGGTLGVTIVDLSTGARTARNGDANLPLGAVQNLAFAVLALREVDAGTIAKAPATDAVMRMLVNGDAQATDELIGVLGGTESVNAKLRALGFGDIFTVPNDEGYASSDAIAHLLTAVAGGSLLSPASSSVLLNVLSDVHAGANRLRAGLTPSAQLMHVTGTLPDTDDRNEATNDAGITYVDGRTMIVVALLHDGRGSANDRDRVLAAAARAAADAAAANP